MEIWELGSNLGDISKYSGNSKVATFNYPCPLAYSCTYYHSTLPAGNYKVEVWGAEGGNTIMEGVSYTHPNKKGGYSVGVLKLNKSSEVYVFIGGKGQDAIHPYTGNARGGYNGGGDSEPDIGDNDHGGAGGGATDIRVDGTEISNRVIVAGGAGGLGQDFQRYGFAPESWGGGLEAGRPVAYGLSYGTPATQSQGNPNGIGSTGVNNWGATTGGGGGGYYGGTLPPKTQTYAGSAGGGSGFIGKVISYNGIEAKSIPGNQTMPSPDNSSETVGRSGNGAARITYLVMETTSQIVYPQSSMSLISEMFVILPSIF